jgi:hypothetical protein
MQIAAERAQAQEAARQVAESRSELDAQERRHAVEVQRLEAELERVRSEAEAISQQSVADAARLRDELEITMRRDFADLLQRSMQFKDAEEANTRAAQASCAQLAHELAEQHQLVQSLMSRASEAECESQISHGELSALKMVLTSMLNDSPATQLEELKGLVTHMETREMALQESAQIAKEARLQAIESQQAAQDALIAERQEVERLKQVIVTKEAGFDESLRGMKCEVREKADVFTEAENLQQQIVSVLKTKLQTTEAALQSVEEVNSELRSTIRTADVRAAEMSDLLHCTKHKLQFAETELAVLQKVHEETLQRLQHATEEAAKVQKLTKELTFVRRDLEDAERKAFRFEKESWQDRSSSIYMRTRKAWSPQHDMLQVKIREEEAQTRARGLTEQLQLKAQEAEQLERKLRQEAKDSLTDAAKECKY